MRGTGRRAGPQPRRLWSRDDGRPASVQRGGRDAARPAAPRNGPPRASKRPAVCLGGGRLAAFGLFFGAASTAHSSNDDFDALLTSAVIDPRGDGRWLNAPNELTPSTTSTHWSGRAWKPLAGSPSPRLHALNRALRLCPSCDTVHEEVARKLWAVGLRRQALLEWRTADDLQPELLRRLLGQLFLQGAKPEELLSLASGDRERMLEVVDFVAEHGRLADAFIALDQAAIIGAPRGETLLRRAALNLQAGNLDQAATAAAAAGGAGFQGPRLLDRSKPRSSPA